MKLSNLLFFVFLVQFSFLQAQSSLVIQGKVIDTESKEALTYSNLSIKNTSLGTVTDAEGRFRLVLPQKYKNDTLAISFLGYETAYLPISKAILLNEAVIQLQSKAFVLSAIEVKPLDALEIIKKAIQNIPMNYDYESKLMTYFYKDYDLKDYKESFLSQQYSLIETVAQVYFDKTTQQTQNVNLAKINYEDIQTSTRLIKTRKLEYFQKTIDKRLNYPVNTYWYMIDVSMQRVSFLNERFFKKYIYELDSLMYLDNQLIYVVSFDKKDNVKPTTLSSGMSKAASNKRYRQSINSLHYGKLYIQADTYAIVKAEYGQNNDYIKSSDKGGRERKSDIYKKIVYQNINKQWYPKYIKIESQGFSQDSNTKLIRYQNSSKQEILITEIEAITQNPILASEKLDFDNIEEKFQAVEEYKEDFWAEYNVLSNIDFKKLFVLDTTALPKHPIVEVLQKSKQAHQTIKNGQYDIEITLQEGLFNLDPEVRKATVTFKKMPFKTLNAFLKVEELMKQTITYDGNKIIEKDIPNNQTNILEPDIDGLSLFYENDFILPMYIHNEDFFLELLKKMTQEGVEIDCTLNKNSNRYLLVFSEFNPVYSNKQEFELEIDANDFLVKKIRLSDYYGGQDVESKTFIIGNLKVNQAVYEDEEYYK